MSRDIEALGQLFVVDAALKSTDEDLAKARATIDRLSSTLKDQTARDAASRTELGELEKRQREAQLDVRSMNQQLEQSREKMNRSRTERETNAVSREMEELRRLIRDREIEVERLQGQAAAITEAQQAGQVALEATQAELATFEGDSATKMTELSAQREQQLAERAAIAKTMSAALFRKYETIRQKRGTGVTTTTDGTCKACNISLAPQLFHRLQREAIIEQCPSCQRLIYYVAPQAPVADAPAT